MRKLIEDEINVTLQPSGTADFNLTHVLLPMSSNNYSINLVYELNGDENTITITDWRVNSSNNYYSWNGAYSKKLTLKNPTTDQITWVKAIYMAEVKTYGFCDDKTKSEVYSSTNSFNIEDLFVLRCSLRANATISGNANVFVPLNLPSYIGNLAYYIGIIDAQFFDDDDERLPIAVLGLDETIYSSTSRGIYVRNLSNSSVTIDKQNSDVLLLCVIRKNCREYR